MRAGHQVAVLSVKEDLHALAVAAALESRHGIPCHVVETNALSGSGGFTWTTEPEGSAELPTRDGHAVAVESLGLIWARRIHGPQLIASDVQDEAHVDLINNDCRAALLGALMSEFRGVWINDPLASLRAEHKLVQLRAAQAAGFRVPRTLVSQNPTRIREFCRSHRPVVVKAIRGTQKRAALTTRVEGPAQLPSDDSLALCPAIYQDYIAGERHIRAHCFGDRVLAASIDSTDVDWRLDLRVPIAPFPLPTDLESRLVSVVRRLGLRMGIVDLKLDNDGHPVWLEMNPQGQFLFIEGIGGLDLTGPFADFLLAELPPDRASNRT
jgi:hypothetical protein